MKSHDFDICRAIYGTSRERGSPPVNILELGKNFLVAETNDGRMRIEGVSGCCKWAVKHQCAAAWLDKFGDGGGTSAQPTAQSSEG